MEEVRYSEIIKANQKVNPNLKHSALVKVSILSNITCNQFSSLLLYYLREKNINAKMNIGDYDNIVQNTYDYTDTNIMIIHYDFMGLIGKENIFIEDFNSETSEMLINSIKAEIDIIVKNVKDIPIVIFNLFTPIVAFSHLIKSSVAEKICVELNEHLYRNRARNIILANFERAVQHLGLANSIDMRMYQLSKSLYTIQLWKEYVQSIGSALLYNFGIVRKAIIFDCDNTLWGGVLGEDGIDGIQMADNSGIGRIYREIQKIIVWLANQGILIGLCSKNNPEDVENVIGSHPDMLVRNSHIVIKRVNWEDKATNLLSISKELNIHTDSIVFVDDSPFEINLVRESIPDILTMQVPKAMEAYPSQLLNLVKENFYFSGESSDLNKTKQYLEQNQRKHEETKHASLDEYLASLQIKIVVEKNSPRDVARFSQLTQKTNQFNVTTRRYSETQINNFFANESFDVYSMSVSDKFGDSGVTGLCITKIAGKVIEIDTLLMSCRVMGRKIEYAFINYILKHYQSQRFATVNAKYIPSSKNMPVKIFFPEMGFIRKANENDTYDYSLDLDVWDEKQIDFIEIGK